MAVALSNPETSARMVSFMPSAQNTRRYFFPDKVSFCKDFVKSSILMMVLLFVVLSSLCRKVGFQRKQLIGRGLLTEQVFVNPKVLQTSAFIC